MKKITQLFFTTTLALFSASLSVSAQSVVTLPQSKAVPPQSALTNPSRAKVEPASNQLDASSDFQSPWPIWSLSDKAAYGQYVTAQGSKPALSPAYVQKRSPYAPEDDTQYTYTGFNLSAGLSADGTTSTGGMVNFNLNPFACDTVSSDSGVSPYSYVKDGKLYCYLPIYDSTTSTYSQFTLTVYDANTLEKLEQTTLANPTGETSRVPYIISYDDARDVVYAISIENYAANGDGTSYYLNIINPTTHQLQRIGYIGGWRSDRDKGNVNIKGFTATSGTLRLQNADDSLYIDELDPMTLSLTRVGRTTMPMLYLYGQQPMIYDSSTGNLLVNHYDMDNGTVYYNIAPYLAWGATDNVLKTEEIEKAPTGFTYFYQRPATKPTYTTSTLGDISDLAVTVEGTSTTAHVSFTVPSTTTDGHAVDIPSYGSKNLRCYVYVDNNYTSVSTLPSSITYGDKLAFDLELTSGLHIVTVQLYPLFSEMAQTRKGTQVVCGYDAPTAVTDAQLAINDGVATITWTAPTTGRYADFGSTFDASSLTYTVVRNNDGKVIASDITETSATDNSLADEILTYTYTITAKSHDNVSLGTTTNAVSAGTYMPLPYMNEFSSSDAIDAFTVLNVDDNGIYRTWNWNYYYKYIDSGWGNADDWLITPTFNLNANALYAFSYKLTGSGELYTTVGQGNTVSDQDNVLDELHDYSTGDDWETKEYYFRPTEDGQYNFGLHNFSTGDEDGWNIDSMSVKQIALISAPDKVRSLTFTPDAKGALGGTLSFRLPATDIAGNQLTTLSKVVVYDLQGNEIATSTSVAPGVEAQIKVQAIHGYNDFKIVAANDYGEGYPALVRQYVGPDVPKAVTQLTATWGEELGLVNLAWQAPTEGVHGGYVDPASLSYKFYKYDSYSWPQYTELAETGSDTSVEFDIQDASSQQEQYVFAITAVSSEGESDYARRGIVLGTPYGLPFSEPFSSTAFNHSPWLISAGLNDQAWTLDEGYFNANIQPANNDGLQLLLRNTSSEPGSSSFVSPIIDFADAQHPVLTLWLHHSDAMPEGAYVTVNASLDGSNNYVAVADTTHLTGNSGWVQHIFDLSALKGKKAQVALNAYLPDGATRIFADDWNICDAIGNDLALTAISQPYMPVVGDTATIAVTVANAGTKSAQSYSVLFTLNGETIAEVENTEPLPCGKEAIVNFELPITAAQSEYLYSATVLYDEDDNLDNNTSSEVELTPTQIDLPAPSSLVLSGNNALAWCAPEAMDGREVMLDFEDVPAFMTDNIKGWQTVDRDGHLTTTFIQYYNNYWPYANQPLAWMTWSAKEAGCADAEAWQPYAGDKCIIAWGNYGSDAQGHTNTELDDDWIISPEVKGGTAFSFMTAANDASCSLEVLTSSTDRQPDSFTNKVTTVGYEAMSEWKEVSVTLPDDAKYVAIRVVCNGFGILVDNIAYTEAQAPILLGYNVYCNNEGESFATTNEAQAAAKGDYAVSAVYNLGESALSNSVSVTTGIAEAAQTGVSAQGGHEVVVITGAQGQSFTLYTAGGVEVASGFAHAKECIKVPAGIYVAKVGEQAYKVAVR